MEGAQRRQVGHAKGQLVDHVESQVRRPAGGQDQLVMLVRVPAQEDQLHRPQVARIGLGESQGPLVEAGHAVQVGDVQADVTELQLQRRGGWHGFVFFR